MSVTDPWGPPLPRRSVSQLKQYEKCPHSYYLSRLAEPRAWQRPAAWLAQGTALHTAAEAWERSGRTMSLEDAEAVYDRVYFEEIDRSLRITPNPEFWSRSGRYGARQDIPRRFGIGREMVGRYVDYYTRVPDQAIWIDSDGKPAIELEFDIVLDGVRVVGFIDQVIYLKDISDLHGPLMVRDIKSGNNPGDDFQLGVYGLAVAMTYGIEQPAYGDYWMGRPGKPTYPYRIDDWTEDRVTEEFRKLEDNIQAGIFEPDPEPDKCKFCDVSAACKFRA